MNKKTKDYIIIGFAIFSLFFGSGNLIFPPKLGESVGSHFFLGIIGFCATGVFVPLLGLIACIRSHGNFEELSLKIGKNFSRIFSILLVLLIGPIIAIPRTAAITYSLTIEPNFTHSNIFEFLIVFLLLIFFLVIRPSKIVEVIGTYLTPILLIILLSLIIKGIITPVSSYSTTSSIDSFPKSLMDGYQTMDTIASIIFASLIIGTIKKKGYEKNERLNVVLKSSIVAVIGLCVVYGGLIYLGSRTGILGHNLSKTSLLLLLANSLLGKAGAIGVELVLAIGCISTSVGLLSASGDFFVRISKNKIRYNYSIVIMLIIIGLIASVGLGKIISISTVILNIIYPVTIVIIILNLMDNIVKFNIVFKLCTYITLLFSLLNAIPPLSNYMDCVPLTNMGFGWLIPFIVTFLFSNYFIPKKYLSYKHIAE